MAVSRLPKIRHYIEDGKSFKPMWNQTVYLDGPSVTPPTPAGSAHLESPVDVVLPFGAGNPTSLPSTSPSYSDAVQGFRDCKNWLSYTWNQPALRARLATVRVAWEPHFFALTFIDVHFFDPGNFDYEFEITTYAAAVAKYGHLLKKHPHA